MDPKYWYIDGVAYDFKDFVKSHPGGIYALYLGRGTECQSLLHSYHLTVPPQALLDKYKLPKEQQPSPELLKKFAPAQKFTYNKGDFFDTVKEEVKAHFRASGKGHKADFVHVAMFVVNVLLILWSYFNMIAAESYLMAAFHGIFRAVLVMQTTHAASHFSFSFNPEVNRWAYRIGTILIGLWSPKNWDLQHVVAHHVYTNEWPYDSDSAFPIKSILHNQRRFWYHKYQHIYMWPIYASFIPLIMLNSIRELIVGRQVTFKMRYHHASAKPEAFLCSSLGALYLLLPFICLPFWSALKLAAATNILSSVLFSLQFVVNHEVDTIISDKPHAASIDFGQFQLEEAFTFAPKSLFHLEFSGGLNTQIEHHLFPGVHYSHYREVSKIIRSVAARFNLDYQYSDSWWGAVKKHYNLLKNPPVSSRDKEYAARKAAQRAAKEQAVADASAKETKAQ